MHLNALAAGEFDCCRCCRNPAALSHRPNLPTPDNQATDPPRFWQSSRPSRGDISSSAAAIGVAITVADGRARPWFWCRTSPHGDRTTDGNLRRQQVRHLRYQRVGVGDGNQSIVLLQLGAISEVERVRTRYRYRAGGGLQRVMAAALHQATADSKREVGNLATAASSSPSIANHHLGTVRRDFAGAALGSQSRSPLLHHRASLKPLGWRGTSRQRVGDLQAAVCA